ncbi:23S rRNA (adenine(2503)-C(2))-methyltransferase RlmN [bacterium]|nr:23S rRNA (adenine(2503)-C(2))-methyltransferase RlmN [bacterium]
MDKIVLSGLKPEEIENLTKQIDDSKYRAQQISNWVYLKSVSSIDDMTNLSLKFREQLKNIATVTHTKIKRKQVSKDGTIKYLVEFADGQCVETVLMRFDNRANLTACVSSQVGCAVNCSFCATGKSGFVRNLTPSEIVEQVLTIQRDTGLKVTNVVFMGQGEPLLNLDNVLDAINILNTCCQISLRRITVSTSGIAKNVEKFALANSQSTLAWSLHAPTDEIRNKIMPINKKYSISEMVSALQNYIKITNNRITIEYLLIDKITDTFECAKNLAELLKKVKCNINLIPYNPVVENDYKKPSKSSIMKFKYILEHSGKKVTVRLERGADIDAACGQLRGKIAT